MNSATDIANLALSLIGESGIASIEDVSDKASRACGTNYAQARDEVLAMGRWGFAKRQVTLSRLAEDPGFGWSAAFELPGDFIRLCRVEGVDAWVPREYFDVMGRRLVMNVGDGKTTVNVEYIRRETDASLFSPLFVEALSYKLAHKIAKPLTDSDRRSQELMREFEQVVLPRCRTVDAQQRASGENQPFRSFLGRSRFLRSRGAVWLD